MGIDKLILIAATLAVLTVSTGQLHLMVHAVRVAEARLIYASRASALGRPMMLSIPK